MVFYIWSVWTNRLICTVTVPQRFWPLRSRDVTSSVTWPLSWQYMAFRRCSIWIHRLLRTVVEILSLKDTGITTLSFWGHVTSSVTWPLDSQYPFSYRWSIWTERLSLTVFEILSFKGIGVTTLTFQVTWRHRSCDHWIPTVWFQYIYIHLYSSMNDRRKRKEKKRLTIK